MEGASLNQVRIGDPLTRVDGRLKVTGGAKYAVEYDLPDMAYGVLVTSTIAKGRIKNIDTSAAEKAPGVLSIITYVNSPKVPGYDAKPDPEKARVVGQEFRLFYDEKIHFNNQPIALAVADTFERATYAASLVKVEYVQESHQTDIRKNLSKAYTPKRPDNSARGIANAYKSAPVHIEEEYQTPIHVHNPMEPHATTAVWEGDRVTVYNKTQASKLAQSDIMKAFSLPEANVHVHSPFVGGAFGSSSRIWPQEMAAILGAKKVGRPVKVALRRDQVFNMVGYRPRSVQKVGLGATPDGKLVGITHEAYGSTSAYEQFTERTIHPTKSLYNCPNLNATYRLISLDLSTPCWTRGPGETSGSFALESAMDELAYALKMDPMALRLANYAEVDPENGTPWSSNYLKMCYEQGAKRFGWSKRNPVPRSTRDGSWLIGTGMAAGIYHANRSPATARAVLQADGTLIVQSATADVGPGTYTIMTQIAADVMGMDPARVRFELGDSSLPPAPGQFGSHTTASVGSAVHDVCVALKEKLQVLAADQKNRDGQAYADLLKQRNLTQMDVTKESKEEPDKEKRSGQSFCANFVEVRVHAATGEVRVSRVVSALDVGKVINQHTARSQVLGSVVWGIGMALMEDGVIDHRYGRYVTKDLADYHVPVCADVPAIDVILIDQPDAFLDPIGAKGIGEIGLIGFAAAMANAVYHATGKRIRELPITPDKLL
ncbi:xanthine dehydrogenase family protein molybdopterin-binding subunit [Spirosoma endophyticum]|uniref:Xanthine dehydrogenase YagR molybdenum-binding subunit n=1 Tax=Spirosoma endophyticum TaxID=662367 RepID=A0A1I1I652_9BACT|nr:xanthine dehydrogenase family protein molybdopterin-binding subunit [Spirosoma endophyticum]SFC29708.1 xanthine dehydrogenase YagR molybdenum-binding subunit [Spirosoma endophyticum]